MHPARRSSWTALWTCVLVSLGWSDPQLHDIDVSSTDPQGATVVHTRSFYLSVPPNAVPGQRYPVIFAFHGKGHSGTAMFGRWDTADFFDRFIFVFPNASPANGKAWLTTNAGNRNPDPYDIDFVRAIHAVLLNHPLVDTGRFYATGFSSGGGMTWELLIRPSTNQLFRGFAPVSSAMGFAKEDVARTHELYHSAHPKPLMYIHGTADDNWVKGLDAVGLPGWRHSDPHTSIRTWLDIYALNPDWLSEHVYADNPTVDDHTVAVGQSYADPVPSLGLAVASIFIVGGGHHYPRTDGSENKLQLCKDMHASVEIVRFWERYADLP